MIGALGALIFGTIGLMFSLATLTVRDNREHARATTIIMRRYEP